MTTAIQNRFLEQYAGPERRATLLEPPAGADLHVRFETPDGDRVDLVAREFDPNVISDRQLHTTAVTLGESGSPVALCGRVDEAMAIRLVTAGWGHFDSFGNADIYTRFFSNRVRYRNPASDARPAEMMEGLLQNEIDGAEMRTRTFWSDVQRRPDVVDDSCFSQWYLSPFSIDLVSYPTGEHWLMAEKARLMGDEVALKNVLAADHPAEAKNHGRRVRWFSDAIWDAERFEVAVRGSVAKFGSNGALRSRLLTTGNTVLVEASPIDIVWGVGLAADSPLISKPSEWRGQNLLGFALMAAREQLSETPKFTSLPF